MKGKKGGGTVEEKADPRWGSDDRDPWAATAAAGHGAAAGGRRPVEHVRHVKPGRRTLSRAPRSHAPPAVRSSASQKRSSVQQVHGSAAAQV